MLFLLFLAVVVLSVLLSDTRSRLKRLEDRLDWERHEASASLYDSVLPEPAPVPRTAQTARVIYDASASQTGAVREVEAAAGQTVQAGPAEQAEDAPSPQPQIGTSWSFEDIFGRKLPIWAGGVTLAVATVLFVKYSIDVGLLSPLVRVVLGLLFGAGLIGGAEWALREDDRVGDPRIRQALAGAGIASLYASILAAANLYGLIDGNVAFAGLAATTMLAMGLSLRFGMPSAILGLVGGLAAPALIGSTTSNIPLLCGYLALAIGGLTAVSRYQRWVWLGVGALLGGAGWSLVLMLAGALSQAGAVAVGLLIVVLAIALPLAAFKDEATVLLRGASAMVGALQMAILLSMGGFTMLNWGLYGLLSAGMIGLSARNMALRALAALSLAVALMLAALWPHPEGGQFATVMLAMAALYGAPTLVRSWRGGGTIMDALEIGAVSLGGYLVTLYHFHGALDDTRSALLALTCAVLPGAVAAAAWKQVDDHPNPRFMIASAAASLLLLFAGHYGLPDMWKAIAATIAILSAGEISRRARSRALFVAMTVFAGGAVLAALWPIAEWVSAAALSLAGKPLYVTDLPSPTVALWKLGIPALLAGAAVWRIWPMLRTEVRLGIVAVPALCGVASLHIFYKQIFALSDRYDFVNYGLGERLVWEALIISAGYALWRRLGKAQIALPLIAAAAAHDLWYNVLLHNPMTADQAVGPAPFANLLLGVYGLPMLALWLVAQIVPERDQDLSRAFDIGRMFLLLFGAYAMLRQLFAGSLLPHVPVSELENILRSVLAIMLALAFLLWGIWKAKRDWRIGSLVLMLAAVGKVFLFDIAGLTGLLRIMSFLALGFSLIGIGWLYSHFLRREGAS